MAISSITWNEPHNQNWVGARRTTKYKVLKTSPQNHSNTIFTLHPDTTRSIYHYHLPSCLHLKSDYATSSEVSQYFNQNFYIYIRLQNCMQISWIPNYVRQTSEFLCATACSAYMLSIARPSVRSVIHRKTVQVRILEFSPYGSPIPLVFVKQVSSRNSKGFPRAGASNKEGWAKSAVFYLCEYLENGSRYS